jgi:hypothetical protein
MSDLRIIAISTAAALVCLALARNAERNGKPWRFRIALVLALAVSCWLIYFGVSLVRGGQPPLISHPWISTFEDGRTSLTLEIARNWAYGVILLGVAFALQACKQLLFSFWRPE